MAKNTPLIKDWFLLGMVTGMAASVAKAVVNYGLDKAGVPTIPHQTLASSMLLRKRARLGGLLTRPPASAGQKLLGYAADTFAGGAFGVALSYLNARTPAGNEAAKGALGGATLGMLTLAAGNGLNLAGFRRLKTGQAATVLGLDALFGGLAGVIFGRYGAKLVRGRLQVADEPVGRVAGRDVRRPAEGAPPAGEGQGPSAGIAVLDLGISPTIL
jgi:hypothetical protein